MTGAHQPSIAGYLRTESRCWTALVFLHSFSVHSGEQVPPSERVHASSTYPPRKVNVHAIYAAVDLGLCMSCASCLKTNQVVHAFCAVLGANAVLYVCCTALRWHNCPGCWPSSPTQPQPVTSQPPLSIIPPSLLPSLPRLFPLLGFSWMVPLLPSFPPHPENKCPPNSRVTLPSGFLPPPSRPPL